MDVALAPHVLHMELLAPLLHPGSGVLPAVSACPRLHRLTLRHVHSTALPALGGLIRLQRLDVTGRGARVCACLSMPGMHGAMLVLQLCRSPTTSPHVCSRTAVLFTTAGASAPGWLDWVSGLHQLHTLHLTAAVTWLQPEEGLQALLPLRQRLSSLRLDGCVLLTDAGAQTMAQLRCAPPA